MSVVVVATFLLLLWTEIPPVEPLRTFKSLRGTWPLQDGWLYVNHFCFAPSGGSIEWQVNGVVPQHTHLLVYNNSNSSWGALYQGWDGKSCIQRTNTSYAAMHVNLDSTSVGTVHVGPRETPGSLLYRTAIGNCLDHSHHVADIELHLTNSGGWWTSELSADQQGLLPLYISVSLALMMIVVAATSSLAWVRGTHREMKTQTVISFLNLILWLISCIFYCVNYIFHASVGFGMWGILPLAFILEGASFMCTVLFGMITAQGWQVVPSQAHTPLWHRWIAGVVSGVLGMLHMVMIVALLVVQGTPSEVTMWYWHTIPGLMSAVVLAGAAVALAFMTIHTWRQLHPENPRHRIFIITWGSVHVVGLFTIALGVFGSLGAGICRRRFVGEALQVVLYSILVSVAHATAVYGNSLVQTKQDNETGTLQVNETVELLPKTK